MEPKIVECQTHEGISFIPIRVTIPKLMVTVCVTNEQSDAVLRTINPDAVDERMSPNALASTQTYVWQDVPHTIICVSNTKIKRDQLIAVLSHEAVHAKQHYMKRIGEEEPGKEFEAYFLQSMVEQALVLYDKAKRQKEVQWVEFEFNMSMPYFAISKSVNNHHALLKFLKTVEYNSFPLLGEISNRVYENSTSGSVCCELCVNDYTSPMWKVYAQIAAAAERFKQLALSDIGERVPSLIFEQCVMSSICHNLMRAYSIERERREALVKKRKPVKTKKH